MALLLPVGAADPFGWKGSTAPASASPAHITKSRKLDISPYKGLATWVDMFNAWPWDKPEGAAAKMAKRGANTLFLQTSNYRKYNDLYRPTQMGKLLEAAHAQGLKVVAWYLPSFKNLKRDLRRAMAAVRFESANGERFDSFALDIESTEVNKIPRRNDRLHKLSKRLRNRVGRRYVLGGIIPDAQSTYWLPFPYLDVAQYYDVIMPMSYFSYRVHGKRAVHDYTATNIAVIRERSGDPAIPIHVIGGIAGDLTQRETNGYVNAVQEGRILGGSYYDFPITTRREWKILRRLQP